MNNHRPAASMAILGLAVVLGSVLKAQEGPAKWLDGQDGRELRGDQDLLQGKDWLGLNGQPPKTYILHMDASFNLTIAPREGPKEATYTFPKPKGAINFLMFDGHGNFYFRLLDGRTADPITGEIGNKMYRGGPGAKLKFVFFLGVPSLRVVKMVDGEETLVEEPTES